MKLEDLGLVGNCQFAALIHADGDVVWCCWPRFDSEPVFGRLLDPDGGRFGIGAADGTVGHQRYLDNTNVLETTFEAPNGRIRVTDFAPRFERHGRMFRPTQLIRMVEPLEGVPLVRVRCEPVLGWTKARPAVSTGSHHLQFEGFAVGLAAHDRSAAVLPGRARVRSRGTSLPGAHVGRTDRGRTAGLLRRPAAGHRPALAALGEALRHSARLPARSHPFRAGA